ncbi:metallophosphoesterase [Alloacidobacterium sp.]|uniref:metallophosphoesterase n=1 Tax=Alloacidobacterium sp. TaxID=2951999 RepID=UPI002D2C8A43|nr:metallophosphoesterase [Alloacidobacterium sp.]HYK36668.1 metallophosphoesterase [Alloacidobacterium sp.]
MMSVVAAEKERVLTRRQFLSLSGLSVLGLGFYAGEIARHEIDIVQRTITVPGLPKSFKGFRIAQISDIHFREYTEASFLKLVLHAVNALKPDLVALTGDFVSYGPLAKHRSVGWAYTCGELLTRIQCPLRYAVLGNHDCIVSEAAARDALTTHGIPVLNNASVPLEHGNQRIWLAGIADALSGNPGPDFEKAVPKTARGDNERVILMAHEPDILPRVAKHGFDLMLSGHTHGGQVRLPFLPPLHLPPMGVDYVEGYFRLGQTQLYVNRGIGTVGLPFRLNCPPEITLITLA